MQHFNRHPPPCAAAVQGGSERGQEDVRRTGKETAARVDVDDTVACLKAENG